MSEGEGELVSCFVQGYLSIENEVREDVDARFTYNELFQAVVLMPMQGVKSVFHCFQSGEWAVVVNWHIEFMAVSFKVEFGENCADWRLGLSLDS